MLYSKLCEIYEKISSTTKRLEKRDIILNFLLELKQERNKEIIYLLLGKILPDSDPKELGISQQILMKAISKSFGNSLEEVVNQFKELGDLGDVSQLLIKRRNQSFLFKKELTLEKVFENLRKIVFLEGKGAIEKKIALISELYSLASPIEAKYLSRTILGNLRIGVSTPTVLDAFSDALFKGENKELIQEKYDLTNDLAKVFVSCLKGKKELERIGLEPGFPVNVMLAVKAKDLEEAFEICGKPAAIEQKYDGFRMLLNKDSLGKISLFTRKLENVTSQFPEVVELIKKNISGKSFVLDSEVVGFDRKTKKYLPFEAISQRIRRKYEIARLVEDLPVEVNVFDCLFYNGKEMLKKPFVERRRIIEEIIKEEKLKIRPAVQIVTSSIEEANTFFEEALKLGEEGIMIKSLNSEYKQGRRVGYMCKLKPDANDLDLVIVGAEYGTGKRSGSLTSFIVACREGDDLLEIGRVSSGLKEKEEEGLTYEKMTEILTPLIESEKDNIVAVRPQIVVSVSYQNIQPSPSYSSGYALRFPRILRYRPDRSWKDTASLEEIRKEVKQQGQSFKKEKPL